jgi:hypothetical protein
MGTNTKVELYKIYMELEVIELHATWVEGENKT